MRRILPFALLLVLPGGSSLLAGDEPPDTVGRVRVTALPDADAEAVARAASALQASLGASARTLWVGPTPAEAGRLLAIVYDDVVERAFDLVLDASGREVSRTPHAGQPSLSPAEREQAHRVVRGSELFKEGLETYDPMPPVSMDDAGRRLINVGLRSPHTPGVPVLFHEIVSVHLPSSEIVRYPSGAPPRARSILDLCGPEGQGCGAVLGSCLVSYQVEWPAAQPVWRFTLRHPRCTSQVQPDGTGLELTDVRYQGRLILRRAEMPVLNVKYDGDACGPYRDWLTDEDCFQAVGVDVPSANSGIRVASAPPATFCETGSDAGSFRGVAIHDEGDSLYLVTEMPAGWYRYVMAWRLHLDGTIEPTVGFGAVSDPCTCEPHQHHGYWRLDWAIDGDPPDGSVVLERRHSGAAVSYDTVDLEGTFLRAGHPDPHDRFRVLNSRTGRGYVIEPGPLDGSASGDPFGQWDMAALVARDQEINDPGLAEEINAAPWLNPETLEDEDRVVTWYRAGYRHDAPAGVESCEVVGPRLVPVPACESSLVLEHATYGCGTAVPVTLNDPDRCGAGALTVQATSAAEPAGETVALLEGAGPCGHFEGAVSLTQVAADAGDGLLSVGSADEIRVRYLDSSFCGQADFLLDKRAQIDCLAPTISDVAVNLMETSTLIQWTTSEPASTVLHYGFSVSALVEVPGPPGTSHRVTLNNLQPCTTYYFWVESADAVGNGLGNHTGGYYAFTRPRSDTVTCAPSAPPPPVRSLAAARLDASGSRIHLAWDPTCAAKNHHLALGLLSLFPSYAVSSGVCGLGPVGSYDWLEVPPGDLWFLVVADDADFTEGSWGLLRDGTHRNGATAVGWCGFTQRTNAGICP